MSKFGRYAVPEPIEAMLSAHIFDGTTKLKKSDHEPKVDVLDQEDLIKQGIDTSVLVPDAPVVDALGSCTFNTGTEALSNALPEAEFEALPEKLGIGAEALTYTDTVLAEKCAIVSYHKGTDQTGKPGEEWPPTDCGSSGPYIVELYQSLGLIKGQQIAHGAQNIVSLMQKDGILIGMPFLNAWMDPPSGAVVDGNGSASTLEAQIRQGVAGGHEIYGSAIEKLTLTSTGKVVADKTIIRFRNHWTKSYGDHGSGRFHLSTFVALGGYCDFRQLVA